MTINRIARFFDGDGMAKTRTSAVTNERFAEAVFTLLKPIEDTDTVLATKIGISQGTITNYRKGELPAVKSQAFAKFCRYFGVSQSQLRKGKIVEAAKIEEAVDLHDLLDQILQSDAADAAETTLRALWQTHVSGSHR